MDDMNLFVPITMIDAAKRLVYGVVTAERPDVAALELSRSKLAAWASLGVAFFVVFGWIAEATVKQVVAWAWSHLH